jgi:hypothetical protein
MEGAQTAIPIVTEITIPANRATEVPRLNPQAITEIQIAKIITIPFALLRMLLAEALPIILKFQEVVIPERWEFKIAGAISSIRIRERREVRNKTRVRAIDLPFREIRRILHHIIPDLPVRPFKHKAIILAENLPDIHQNQIHVNQILLAIEDKRL